MNDLGVPRFQETTISSHQLGKLSLVPAFLTAAGGRFEDVLRSAEMADRFTKKGEIEKPEGLWKAVAPKKSRKCLAS